MRLLVPGPGSDLPLMQAVSRAGYRALLEAGVRVFEWNGSMLHAKTAVADARWARVGSTNLNLASWIGNRELDVVVEDEAFGRQMEEMFQEDLGHATEIVLQPLGAGTPGGQRPPAPRPRRRREHDARRGRRAPRRQRPRVRPGGAPRPRSGGEVAHGRGRAAARRRGRPRIPVAAPAGLAARRGQPVAGPGAPRPAPRAGGRTMPDSSARTRRDAARRDARRETDALPGDDLQHPPRDRRRPSLSSRADDPHHREPRAGHRPPAGGGRRRPALARDGPRAGAGGTPWDTPTWPSATTSPSARAATATPP